MGAAKLALEKMKTRADFLRAQAGHRRSTPGLGLETCPTPVHLQIPGALRVGFTASRKVGNAVARNRAKRRLRAAAATILPLYGRAGRDYVLVARVPTITRPFALLVQDLSEGLARVHAALDRQEKDKPRAAGTNDER